MRRALFVLMLAACDDTSRATSDAASDGPPPDADACGTRAGQRGRTRRNITAGGLARTYTVYIPDGASDQPMPLVFVMHGYTMSGDLMFEITDYAQLADQEKFAIAFPDGQSGPNSQGAPWNVGANVCPSYAGAPPIAPGDDDVFLDAMKADISQDQCLDREHVFITGFSMGGYFSHHASCTRDDIRAAAPHSGGTHDLASCTVGPKPMIIFHGDSDPLIPAGCNDPDAPRVSGVTPAATAWAIHNGCSSTTTTTETVRNGTCDSFVNCPDNGQVTVCSFPGMGHCWAGGAASAGIYSCNAYASATRLAWDFFKTHAWD